MEKTLHHILIISVLILSAIGLSVVLYFSRSIDGIINILLGTVYIFAVCLGLVVYVGLMAHNGVFLFVRKSKRLKPVFQRTIITFLVVLFLSVSFGTAVMLMWYNNNTVDTYKTFSYALNTVVWQSLTFFLLSIPTMIGLFVGLTITQKRFKD